MQQAYLSRRNFIKCMSSGLCALGWNALIPASYSSGQGPSAGPEQVKEVMFYTKLPDQKVECGICPKKCKIADLERGYCGNKENRGGAYYTLVHSRPCAVHIDPIEKNPYFTVCPLQAPSPLPRRDAILNAASARTGT